MTRPQSTKPYLLRALYEWCVDSGCTPYISVVPDAATRVPREYVRDGEIVLNIGPLAANRLKIGNDAIEFAARFGGVAREIWIPVARVAAIYARENGQGMSFEVADAAAPAGDRVAPAAASEEASSAGAEPPEPPSAPRGGRPSLRRIK